MDELRGTVKIVTYHNSDNGYFVVKVLTTKGEKTVTGSAPSINPGEHIYAKGTWTSSNWGPQLKATQVVLSMPSMIEGIESYLANAVEGIGKGYARKLVEAFGADVFDVIEKTPEKLKDVKGIGKNRALSIIDSYSQQKAIREIMVFLHKNGLSTSKAKRVYDIYKEDAIAKISENPYILCKDVWGIGFSTADKVALSSGIPPDSDFRVKAAIGHVLKEAEGQGSCGVSIDTCKINGKDEPGLIEKVWQLIQVDEALIKTCLQEELDQHNLVKDTALGVECIFSARIYKAEKDVAAFIKNHSKYSPKKVIKNVDIAILDAEMEMGIHLEDAQREAVRVALTSQICVITGGPGSGKTTITKVILRALQSELNATILLAAPTGKAAKRATESTGIQAVTIHRALEIGPDGKFKRNSDNNFTQDVLSLDELSMVDIFLLRSTFNAVSPSTRVILVGDADQLPSVGPGKALADLIESGAIPTVRLTTIFRQAATSSIIKNAHAINKGLSPEVTRDPTSDFQYYNFSPVNDSDEAKKECQLKIKSEILKTCLLMRKKGWDAIKDVQVLAPMRKGVLGTEQLNLELQQLLNPPSPSKDEIEIMGTKWRVGDKVMQQRNNYNKEVFNGDVGYVSAIDKPNKLIDFLFEDRTITFKFTELDELALAYAFTIHKSQGSEFPVLIMPLHNSHYTMLKRNLLYTGVTRAKKLCYLIAQKRAVDYAVSQNQVDTRFTCLKKWLTM